MFDVWAEKLLEVLCTVDSSIFVKYLFSWILFLSRHEIQCSLKCNIEIIYVFSLNPGLPPPPPFNMYVQKDIERSFVTNVMTVYNFNCFIFFNCCV